MAGHEETFNACRLSLTPVMDTARAHYSGPSRKIVVALDIGITFSCAAYALLDPGEVPQIQTVTRQVFSPTFGPGDERSRMRGRYLGNPKVGSAKVPSILYYDHKGNFCGVENGLDFQDDDRFLRVGWWDTVICSLVQDANSALGGSQCSHPQ